MLIDACAFIQECAKTSSKRGYKCLNKRSCATIQGVRMFEIVLIFGELYNYKYVGKIVFCLFVFN